MNAPDASNIDEYIAAFPAPVAKRLRQIRRLAKELVPESTEAIKYRMPTIVLGKNLLHFAGYKEHIGLYPAPIGVMAFKTQLEGYVSGKGSIQFQHNEPLPLDLIAKIIKYRKLQLEEQFGKKTKARS